MSRATAYNRQATIQHYANAYVELDRIRRRADEQQAAFKRWIERIAVAERAGEPDLAAAARERALRAAKLEIELRSTIARMERDINALRELAR